jgi:hypothetical protein
MGPRNPRRKQSRGRPILLSERLHGVREWSLHVDEAGELRLGGFGARLWRDGGEATEALCEPVSRYHEAAKHREVAPGKNCDCGLYALHPSESLEFHWSRWGRDDRTLLVVGLVEAWGTLRVHAEGFRAQFARPTAFVLVGRSLAGSHARLIADIAERHHCELLVLDSYDELREHCAREGLGLAQVTVDEMLG